jgi:uncharacterized membrane protein (DUF373 family)
MELTHKIHAHYDFSELDANRLRDIKPIMEEHLKDFPGEFYKFVKNFDEADKFLKDEATIKRHQDGLADWYRNLFSGNYGPVYLHNLENIGMMHVKINLDPHYVNAAMHFVNNFCIDIVTREIDDREQRIATLRSLEKILDINLDVITSSYIEEEKKRYFISSRFESLLIQFSNRFSYGLNLVLVLGLVSLGIMVMGLFVYDVTHIFQGNIEKGLLSSLGSLLMLWVVIELMDTEIEHLKGEKFAIKVFISVALVAVIRKILVTSLKAEAVEAQLSLILAVAVLGGVYWLVAKVDN